MHPAVADEGRVAYNRRWLIIEDVKMKIAKFELCLSTITKYLTLEPKAASDDIG